MTSRLASEWGPEMYTTAVIRASPASRLTRSSHMHRGPHRFANSFVGISKSPTVALAKTPTASVDIRRNLTNSTGFVRCDRSLSFSPQTVFYKTLGLEWKRDRRRGEARQETCGFPIKDVPSQFVRFKREERKKLYCVRVDCVTHRHFLFRESKWV
jgi:hypothetical protein